MSTPHIEASKEEISKYVLMPGDPKRCEYIAKNFLTDARLINDVRGNTAYTGNYKGKMVTIFPSGMGIASMGIYSYELFYDYDVDVIIRVGTAGSYEEDLKVYDILLVESAFSETNYDEEAINRNVNIVNASVELNSKIIDSSIRLGIDIKTGRIHTTEAFYKANDNIDKYYYQYNCLAVEMESFALFLNARRFNKKATSLLTISDELLSKKSISSEERELKLNKMITLALESIITM
jgi:purine-nucleoside phosphorylase